MGVSLLLERDRAVGTLGIATDSETYQPLYDIYEVKRDHQQLHHLTGVDTLVTYDGLQPKRV